MTTLKDDWKLSLTISADHPQEAIGAYHDMLQYIDAVIASYSSQGHMEKSDGPLFVTLQDTSGFYQDAVLHLTEWREHQTLNHPSNDDIVSKREFICATRVVSIETGKRYIIRACIWYALAQEWNYIVYDQDDPDTPFELKANSQLISEQVFQAMHRQLCKITEQEDWTWNPLINMWTRGHHGSRRVRIADVFTIIEDAKNAKTVPF